MWIHSTGTDWVPSMCKAHKVKCNEESGPIGHWSSFHPQIPHQWELLGLSRLILSPCCWLYSFLVLQWTHCIPCSSVCCHLMCTLRSVYPLNGDVLPQCGHEIFFHSWISIISLNCLNLHHFLLFFWKNQWYLAQYPFGPPECIHRCR